MLTCPDIWFGVSVLLQHLEKPGIQHFWAAKKVFCYLSRTRKVGLTFLKTDSIHLNSHVDADCGNCPDTQRSATGYAILTGGQVLSWNASCQSTVSLSSTKAEYKALLDLGSNVVYLFLLSITLIYPSKTHKTTNIITESDSTPHFIHSHSLTSSWISQWFSSYTHS
jgi:hypothetical protein